MSNLERTASPELCVAAGHPAPTLVAYPARTSPLGDGLVVRRLLPTRARRLVGPWCFLDHYGPLAFPPDARPMRVGGHPHIGLQTVSWLLEGEVLHRDSLGSEVLVRPGELSLMTAGRGIAHSEETPDEHAGRLHGVQLWIALPEAERACEPRFEHHATLPRLERPGGAAIVFVGALGEAASPARTPWPAVGAELRIVSELDVPLDPAHEHALVVLAGRPSCDGQALEPDQLYDLGRGRSGLRLAASDDARVLLVGGLPLDEPVLMWWNFVARTADELERAREDWETGRAFGEVPGQRLAAPPFTARPVNRPGR